MNRETVQAEHDRLGYRLGWRFMMSPEATWETSPLGIVGLNPGGSRPHGTDWSYEAGNAYWRESWRDQPGGTSSLQRQVQGLARLLGRAEADTAAAQFVPFRSPSWADLPRRAEATAFAERLWSWRLSQTGPKLLVCLGKAVVGPSIASLTGASLDRCELVGWGSQTVDRYSGADGRVILVVPHLGRFRLIGRPESERAILRAVS